MEIKAATAICITDNSLQGFKPCGCKVTARFFIQKDDIVKIKLKSYSRTIGPHVTGKILDIEVFNDGKNQHVKIDCSKAYQSCITSIKVHDIEEIEIVEGLL